MPDQRQIVSRLIQDCKLYIKENTLTSFLATDETIKRYSPKQVVAETLTSQQEKIPKSTPPKVKAAQKRVEVHKPTPPVQPQTPIKEIAPPVVQHHVSPVKPPFTYLPSRTYQPVDESSTELAATIEKMMPQLPKKSGILPDTLAYEKGASWQTKCPAIVFLSFLDPATSETQFIQKVSTATHERLASTKVYNNPPKQLLGELFVLAELGLLKAVIAVTDLKNESKISEYYTALTLTTTSPIHCEPFGWRGTLFSTPFVDLKITPTLIANQKEKAAVWQFLSHIANSHDK